MVTDNKGPEIAGVTYTFVIISSIATGLRIYCRGWIMKTFLIEDWLAVIAQILFIIYGGYCIAGVQLGTGMHLTDLPPERIPKTFQLWWADEPLYVLTNMAIKASIGLFLLRICVNKVQRSIVCFAIVIIEVYSLVILLMALLQCRPVSLFWLRFSSQPPEGSCSDGVVLAKSLVGFSVINCVSDWTLSILPISLVCNLQMKRRLKISVAFLLALGCIASSATIVRFAYIHTLTDVDDFLYATSELGMWSTIEIGLAITAAGIATLRQLFRKILEGSPTEAREVSIRKKSARTCSTDTAI